MLLQLGALGVTMSWDDGFLGARAGRPHQAWHSLGHLPHLDQPGTAPWLSCGLAAAVPAHRVATCSIALKLSGGQWDRMRAGRPRSQVMQSRPCRGRLAASLNMDTQDNQDEKLVHKKLIGSIIECAFVENLSVLGGPSRTPFESFPTPWNPFADPLPDLWRIPLELSPTPSWPFVVLRGPSWISFFGLCG